MITATTSDLNGIEFVSCDVERLAKRAADQTVRAEASAVIWGAVGKEVGFSLVRESPVASWTRVAWMTHTGAEGQYCPGARFLGFFSDRRLCRRRELWRRRAWMFCMSGWPVLMCTRTRWWLVCGSWWTARRRGNAGRLRPRRSSLWPCGLIQASFVPNEEVQELRALTRTRKQLVREQTRHVQRIEKTLAEANIKLSSVISDIMGASGRRMIQAMIDGVRQPNKLAELAGKQIKASPKELYDALHGRLTDHHRFLLALHLKQWDSIDETIRKLDGELDQRIGRMATAAEDRKIPFRALIELLTTVPGVGAVAAPAILSEIGPDMSRFPTAGHLVA